MSIHAYEQFGFSLTKSGKNWKMCCPFHHEDTPSFMVYADLSYHCFGCHAHGSYEDFVMFFSGDSSRIYYIKNLEDIQVTREEKELARIRQKVEDNIFNALNGCTFTDKDTTWSRFDSMLSKFACMRQTGTTFMDLVLFLKKEEKQMLEALDER